MGVQKIQFRTIVEVYDGFVFGKILKNFKNIKAIPKPMASGRGCLPGSVPS